MGKLSDDYQENIHVTGFENNSINVIEASGAVLRILIRVIVEVDSMGKLAIASCK